MQAIYEEPALEVEDGDELARTQRVVDAPLASTVRVSLLDTKNTEQTEATDAQEHDFNLIFGAVEAQWVLTVLDDCMAKLNISSYLTSAILKDKIVDAVDHNLIIALKEHFQLEKEFVDLSERLAADKLTNDAKSIGPKKREEMNNQKKVLKELDMCLSDSTKTVCRLLQQNSIVVRRLREVKGKRAGGALEFMQVFGRLRKLIHHKLKMTAEEERAMNDQLQDLIGKEQDDTQKFLELTERLKEERNEHTQTISVKDQKIHRLDKQINDLVTRTKRERQLFKEKMRTEEEMGRDAFVNAEIELSKQLNIADTKLATEGKDNWHNEHLLHRQREHKADFVQDKIKLYDEDMMTKHKALLEMQQVYDEESKELAKLTEYFAVVDAENQRLEDEAADIRARRDEQLVLERRTHYSAVLIQKLFRAYGVRETKRKKREAAAAAEAADPNGQKKKKK
jgi:hypothetical protein